MAELIDRSKYEERCTYLHPERIQCFNNGIEVPFIMTLFYEFKCLRFYH